MFIYQTTDTGRYPIECDWNADTERFVITALQDVRMVLSVDEAKRLHYELEGALRHAYDDLGVAS